MAYWLVKNKVRKQNVFHSDDRSRATYTVITWTAIVINVVGVNRNANISSLTNNSAIYSSAGLLAQGKLILIQILPWLDSPRGPRPSHC
jgi:hypothetical protein